MRNAELDKSHAEIKTARRNINNLRYADDITLMAESKEELMSFLMRVKEESEKAGLKLNAEKTKITASGPITLRQIEGEKVEEVIDFIFLGSKITADSSLLWSFVFLQGATSFNFMAAVNIHIDFGVQDNKICHCFHFFPIYLP